MKPSIRTPNKAKPLRSHIVIPDVQCKPGVKLDHLSWAGQYIAHRKPDVVVVLGDWWDMPSLSSYDSGKKSFEGRMYKADIEAGHQGMGLFLTPIKAEKSYHPELIFLYGNHEERILRAVESDRKLEGTIGYHDLRLKEYGFTTYEFLEPVVKDGIGYCHFYPRAGSGAILQTKRGAPSAKAQLQREGRSCTAGHQQGLDVACIPLGGKLQWGIIAGSFYQHDEQYLSPQGNDHWRGLIVKHEVDGRGGFNPMFVSLDYLKRRYGKVNTHVDSYLARGRAKDQDALRQALKKHHAKS